MTPMRCSPGGQGSGLLRLPPPADLTYLDRAGGPTWSRNASEVFFSTTEPGVPIPFGADRALLAWITTLTYDSGFVTFSNLTDFFDAFQLARSGVQYQRFEQRGASLLCPLWYE